MKSVDALWHDVAFATRLLRKSPVFSTAVVLTLALGVGVNTAVFSVVNAIILRPLRQRRQPGRRHRESTHIEPDTARHVVLGCPGLSRGYQ